MTPTPPSMSLRLGRLFRPKSIAVIGGGAWGRAVIGQCRKMGFTGDIWPVHPSAKYLAELPAFARIDDLPEAPDASFIGVNRHQTVALVNQLQARGAGGAVCFASGFLEAVAEDSTGADLQSQLLAAAGDMPILGPNCYGFINYLDGALLWPDQQGGTRVESGVAVITQSSNIAINLTMQKRGLPLAYVVTAGNQAQTGFAEIGAALLEDHRVTALGLHIEGFGDLRAFERMARRAAELGKPIIALKVGKSAEARAATMSHTASLAGGDAGAQALLDRFKIARIGTLGSFLECLKVLHVCGPLPSTAIGSISCSGGEASLIADVSQGRGVHFPPLNARQKTDLRTTLGPMVALANPLDYHTYIWRDIPAMTRAWVAMTDPALAITLLIVDFPRADRCDPSDWDCTIEAALATRAETNRPLAMVASLPELMPEAVAERLIAGGVVPLNGMDDAVQAVAAAARCGANTVGLENVAPLLLGAAKGTAKVIPEADAKRRLARCGLRIPASMRATSPEAAGAAAADIGFPVVLKGEGFAHKSEAGAVRLNLSDAPAVIAAAKAMPTESFLVEEMVSDAVTEILVGVVYDPAHGHVLTLAAGGVLTELLGDRASLLLPASTLDIEAALRGLKIGRVLNGFRGKPAADISAIVAAVQAVQQYVVENADKLHEIEVNPLICTPTAAIAADALLRQED